MLQELFVKRVLITGAQFEKFVEFYENSSNHIERGTSESIDVCSIAHAKTVVIPFFAQPSIGTFVKIKKLRKLRTLRKLRNCGNSEKNSKHFATNS